jgi:hypothetical protein
MRSASPANIVSAPRRWLRLMDGLERPCRPGRRRAFAVNGRQRSHSRIEGAEAQENFRISRFLANIVALVSQFMLNASEGEKP